MWCTMLQITNWSVPRHWWRTASCSSTLLLSELGSNIITPNSLAARKASNWWVSPLEYTPLSCWPHLDDINLNTIFRLNRLWRLVYSDFILLLQITFWIVLVVPYSNSIVSIYYRLPKNRKLSINWTRRPRSPNSSFDKRWPRLRVHLKNSFLLVVFWVSVATIMFVKSIY